MPKKSVFKCSQLLVKQIYQLNVIGLKNPNWREADLLAVNKHDQEVELLETS